MKVLGEKENKGGRMVAGAEEEKFVYKKLWPGMKQMEMLWRHGREK